MHSDVKTTGSKMSSYKEDDRSSANVGEIVAIFDLAAEFSITDDLQASKDQGEEADSSHLLAPRPTSPTWPPDQIRVPTPVGNLIDFGSVHSAEVPTLAT